SDSTADSKCAISRDLPIRRKGRLFRERLCGIPAESESTMKTRIKNFGKALVDRVASRIEARLTRLAVDPRTTPATKIGQLQLWHHYRTEFEAGRAPKLCETGFRCFSQFEEDGLILFIMAALGIQQGVFLDLGSADGVNSNCANLALNFGWRGTFIDGNDWN